MWALLAGFATVRYRILFVSLLAILATGVPKICLRQDQFTWNEYTTLLFAGVWGNHDFRAGFGCR